MSDYYERDEAGGGPRFPPLGPRSRHEDVAVCYQCGEDVREEYRLMTHTFCSRECSDAWVRR